MILRRNGWLFEPVEMPGLAELEIKREAAAADTRQAKAKRNFEALVAYLKEHSYTKLTRRNLEDAYQDIGISRNEIRAVITKGLYVDSTLVELDLPPEEQRGARKRYITVAGGDQ